MSRRRSAAGVRWSIISPTTHPSLLIRVRDAGDDAAWIEFDRRYGDLIIRHCLGRGLQRADAEDVRQAVLVSLVGAMPSFRYAPERGRFRGYLGRVVQNAVHRHLRRRMRGPVVLEEEVIARLRDEAPDETWQEQWVDHHLRRALGTVRQTFDAQSVEVFEAYLAGGTTAQIATRFALSAAAVQKIKERVRERLRALVTKQVEAEDRRA